MKQKRRVSEPYGNKRNTLEPTSSQQYYQSCGAHLTSPQMGVMDSINRPPFENLRASTDHTFNKQGTNPLPLSVKVPPTTKTPAGNMADDLSCQKLTQRDVIFITLVSSHVIVGLIAISGYN